MEEWGESMKLFEGILEDKDENGRWDRVEDRRE